jgi:gluconokinase
VNSGSNLRFRARLRLTLGSLRRDSRRLMGQGWFFFGQIGAGKSSLGAAAARAWGIPFHEGDEDLPPSVIAAIKERRPFTDALRDEFAAVLADRISHLGQRHPQFILAQGLFYNRQRRALLARHPDLRFVWIRAQTPILEDRVSRRSHPLADLAYARLANPHFEVPNIPHDVLENNGTEQEGLEKLSKILYLNE